MSLPPTWGATALDSGESDHPPHRKAYPPPRLPIDDEEPLAFYIFISELAEHTGNLRQNPKASLLFIDNESVSSSLFARKRITYYCKAELIPRDQAIFDTILDRFEARHGPMVALLKTLRDFQLFRLSPMKASYVRGFGEAFEFDRSDGF
ncbi:MAG: HugZ family protein [Gammaproteobacteria bacterium]|nr:HugZ family protein [Gammaproteobacteria bacterium]